MQFTRVGEYLATSRITGPRHNMLQIRLAVASQLTPVVECLPPIGDRKHEAMIKSKIVAQVICGLNEANAKLNSNYAVTHIRYIANDTGPEEVYAYLALKIVEQLVSGGEFAQRAKGASRGQR